jgi:DNA-binding transcriptional regulator LsrR (DeoR family)
MEKVRLISMLNAYSDDQLRLLARLYYVDGLGQLEVARLAKVSQAKVSRLLALARERGIVRITVADYDPRHPELEAALRRGLGLEEVTVVRTAGADPRAATGHFGAAAVGRLIRPGDVVALAGGRTLQALVPHIPSDSARRPVVVQAMGSVEPAVSAHDAQEIGRVLARRLGGTFLALNAPAFIPDKRARDALLQLEQVRAVQGRLARASLALVGIGTLANSVFVERGTLGGEMLRDLQRAGAVGEICGRFFDARGRECATPWRDRVISVGLPQLRRIPLVVAVVTGADRAAALLAAVRSGLVKGLVVDEACAGALVEAAA